MPAFDISILMQLIGINMSRLMIYCELNPRKLSTNLEHGTPKADSGMFRKQQIMDHL